MYIKNISYFDQRTHELIHGDFRIDSGPEGGILPVNKVGGDAWDGTGKILIRSFVCAHHHAYSALARGMPAPRKSPQNFEEILKYVWWHLDKQLDAEMIKASALVTALDCLRNGVTFVIDHHASPNAIPGSLDIIAEAFESLGVGHLLCYEMSDRDGEKSASEGLAETKRYLSHHRGLVGLHASFTVGEDLLHTAVRIAEQYDAGLHLHVAEGLIDQEKTRQKYGVGVIERLDQCRALDFPKTILAHCIHLNENERGILAGSRAWIAVNTESNLNNQVGLFSNAGGLEEKVMLGTDGMHSDMLRSLKTNFMVHKEADGLNMETAYRRLQRVHKYLRENRIPGDSENNLLVLNYDAPTPISKENWLNHFFYGLETTHIDGVIRQGEWAYRNGQPLKGDAAQIMADARQQAARLWQRLK